MGRMRSAAARVWLWLGDRCHDMAEIIMNIGRKP